MMLTSLVLTAGMAAGVATPVPTPPPAAGPVKRERPAPVLVVESATVDVGEIRPGEVAEGTFVFRNTGDREVKILRAAPS